MRCFIAIEIPESVKSKIFHEIEKLKSREGISGKFVEKDNLHITLKFLGNISEQEIENIKEKLSKISFKDFEISLDNYGFFPSEEYIKIIWLGLNSNDNSLINLEKEISKNLLEYPGDFKEFKPHLTLARINQIKDKNLFFKEIKKLKKIKKSFQVNSMVLMKSEIISRKREYKTLKKFDFNNS